jgi:hypothetical protein
MSHRILTSSQSTTAQLDDLILQMEITLGKTHTESPFKYVFQKYGFG